MAFAHQEPRWTSWDTVDQTSVPWDRSDMAGVRATENNPCADMT